MSKTAYLVAWIDIQRFEVVRAGIYSEPYPTPGPQKLQPAALTEAHGTDYESAVKQLCEYIAQHDARRVGPRDLSWVLKFLPENVLARIRDVVCPHCSQPMLKTPVERGQKGQLGQ